MDLRQRTEALAADLARGRPSRVTAGVSGRRDAARWLLAHPLDGPRTLALVARFPLLRVQLSDDCSGRLIADAARKVSPSIGGLVLARSAYTVPSSGRPFTGRSAHGRRNAANRARRQGIEARTLTPEGVEDVHLQLDRHSDCGSCDGRYYAAFEQGKALAFSHVHVDDSVAELVFAVHASGDPRTGPARFLLFEHLVADLAASGVEHLLHLDNVLRSRSGVLELQRVLGFRPVNLKLSRQRRPAPR